ncbi:hypothetical protein D1872_201980 [compost metagenome]
MKKKSSLKVAKKAGVKHKKIILNVNRAHIRQDDLGNGFQRFILRSFFINPGQFLTLTLTGGSVGGRARAIISAGWNINFNVPAYAIRSFPSAPGTWTLTIHNPSPFLRVVSPYIITKIT